MAEKPQCFEKPGYRSRLLNILAAIGLLLPINCAHGLSSSGTAEAPSASAQPADAEQPIEMTAEPGKTRKSKKKRTGNKRKKKKSGKRPSEEEEDNEPFDWNKCYRTPVRDHRGKIIGYKCEIARLLGQNGENLS